MKVAVISMVPTLGKSSLSVVLGGVFSRSQGRDVVILSTGNAKDILDIIAVKGEKRELDNPHMLKYVVENPTENPKDIFSFGTQIGDEKVYLYDVLNSSMSKEDKEDCFCTAVESMPADLTLVEINGDVTSEFNTRVMSLCDCCLLLVDTSKKCLEGIDEFISKLPKGNMQSNVALVIARHDVNVIGDKALSSVSKKHSSVLFKFPYNAVIGKLSVQGILDRLAYDVVQGEHSVMNLRTPLQAIMEFMFNTPKRKVVRSVDRWFR